jgi:hypothetical protein
MASRSFGGGAECHGVVSKTALRASLLRVSIDSVQTKKCQDQYQETTANKIIERKYHGVATSCLCRLVKKGYGSGR